MSATAPVGKLLLEGPQQGVLFGPVLKHLKRYKAESEKSGTVDVVQVDNISDSKSSNKDGSLLLVKNEEGKALVEDVTSFYRQIRAFSNCGFIIAIPLCDGSSGSKAEKSKIQKLFTNASAEWNSVLKDEIVLLSQMGPPSKGSKERLALLDSWLKAEVTLRVTEAARLESEKDIKETIKEVESILSENYASKGICLSTAESGAPTLRLSLGNNSHLPAKPPTLHWSEIPLPEEAQLTWRLRFPCVQPSDTWIQDLIAMCSRESLDSEYIYRWNQGVLLQFETAKVCVSTAKGALNISVRCDPEEIGDSGSQPHEILWQFIQPHLNCAFQFLLDFPKLPYQISLIPYGATYFGTCMQQEVSFSLTSILSSLEEKKRVLEVVTRDSSNDTHHTRLFIDKLFPASAPSSLEELKTLIRSSLTRTRSQRKSSNPTAGISSVHLMACPGSSQAEADSGQSPSKRRMSYDGRRRVSFGHVLIEDAKKLSLDGVPGEAPPSPQLAAKQAADKVKAALAND